MLSLLRHIAPMDRRASCENHSRGVADFIGEDGNCWTLEISSGCEIFVGRFARLAGLETEDGIIRFHSTIRRADYAPGNAPSVLR